MLRVILLAAAGAIAQAAAHAGVDVRHSEGVEMITGRQAIAAPASARTPNTAAGGRDKVARADAQQTSAANTRSGQQKGGTAGMEPLRPPPEKARVDDGGLDGRLPVRDNVSILPDAVEDAGGDGIPKDGATPVRKRLRVTEAVLQDQIAAYNRALLEETPPDQLAPLEDAISHTLDQIDVLVRNTRMPQP